MGLPYDYYDWKSPRGTIQVDAKSLPKGARVTVLSQEGDEAFELQPKDEAKLLAAIAETERWEVVSAPQIFGKSGDSTFVDIRVNSAGLPVGANLRRICRVDSAYPLVARGFSSSIRVHQSDDHGERFRVKGGDLRTSKFALLVCQRGQYPREQTGLRIGRVLLDSLHRLGQWILAKNL